MSRVELLPESPLEELMSARGGFCLPLTPTQRGICRAIDGYPLGEKIWQDALCKQSFRAAPVTEWRKRSGPKDCKGPGEIVICAAKRGGKTMIGVGTALLRALYCDLSWWSESESPPILPIVSVHKHNARAAFRHLSALLHKKGSMYGDHLVSETSDCLTVRHALRPECEIEIVVLAGSKAGTNLESYWLASCVFDECFKMSGRDEGAVNLEDAQTAVNERVIEGGQILYIGTPWAPEGPAYQMVRDRWGKPDSRLIVVRATGPALNPKWWTAERCDKLKRSTKKADRENYITSVLGEFLDPETNLITHEAAEACMRKEPVEIEPMRGVEYVAAMDPATRHNAWTLVIASRTSEKHLRVDLAREWLPSYTDTLDPEVVLREIAGLLARYHLTRAWTDQYSLDALRSVATRYGLSLVEHPGRDNWELYDSIRLAVSTRAIELPPIEQVRLDLTRIVKRPTGTGMRIILPTTADGRHCDYAPPLAMVLAHAPLWRPDQGREMLRDTDEERLEQLAAEDPGAELERVGGLF